MRYVAIGDSFTEGMDDPYPEGTYRGWADLVAARLAVDAAAKPRKPMIRLMPTRA